MGGRGASSGISRSGNKYGTEYSTLYQSGNIKFIKQNGVKNAKTPLETMTDGRVYVSVDKNDNLSSISYYDKEGKRTKQIDMKHEHAGIIPHTHHGYFHNEYDSKKGASKLTTEEKTMIERVNKLWLNRNKKR
ncbi:hypothetical protein [Faecalibacillus intestinalis]|jgi:hypothetical protein|uniref:hypothetical protein n=1 Tax=Faecalibacillus intestinalis TaxID=1982626 RepID=UPI0039A140D8